MEHENARWRLSSSKNRIRALCNYKFNTINNDLVTEEEHAIAIRTAEVKVFFMVWMGIEGGEAPVEIKGCVPFHKKPLSYRCVHQIFR